MATIPYAATPIFPIISKIIKLKINITIPEENEKKDLINLGFKDVFKNLKKLVKKDKEYEKQRAEFDKKLKENEKHFNDSLSEKDIQKAKRDRQLLTKLVEKIDIASQDYAENVEMATNFANIAAIGSGGNYALSAARALDRMAEIEPRVLVEESLKIAGELCIYTNTNIKILELA